MWDTQRLRHCSVSVTKRIPALFSMEASGTAAGTWQSLIHWFYGSCFALSRSFLALLLPWLQALPTFHRWAFQSPCALPSGLRGRRRPLSLQPSWWALLSECSADCEEQASFFCRMLLELCPAQQYYPKPESAFLKFKWAAQNFVIYCEQPNS